MHSRVARQPALDSLVPTQEPPQPHPLHGHARRAPSVHATRRGGARHEVSARVTLKAKAGEVLEGWALNVSRGGIRVILEDKVELGSRVRGHAEHRRGRRRRPSSGASCGCRRSRTASSPGIEFRLRFGANPGGRWRAPKNLLPDCGLYRTTKPLPEHEAEHPRRAARLLPQPLRLGAARRHRPRAQRAQSVALPRRGHPVPRPVVGRQPGEAARPRGSTCCARR